MASGLSASTNQNATEPNKLNVYCESIDNSNIAQQPITTQMPASRYEFNFRNFYNACKQNNFCEDILLSHKVIDSRMPNRYGCCIPLHSNWDLVLMKQLLNEYNDMEIIEWLTYGFSISRNDDAGETIPATSNHMGANLFPEAIDKYIAKEIRLGATMGPFRVPPYVGRIGISPLSTRPKRDSTERRVILDLSFPPNFSVNSGIDKNYYCGARINLTYPSIDDLCKRIFEIGNNCLVWKKDLQRFFRQLPLCPRDYPLISYRWKQLIYIDKNVPMGLTSAAYIAQRTTNSIVYIHNTFGYWSINYLDDFGSAEHVQNAWNSYFLMGRILASIGIAEATEKAVPPTTRMEFLGNTVDTVKMTLEVSHDRKLELDSILKKWMHKTTCRKKELQSLIGKLSFVTNCVRAGRLFLARMLDTLRNSTDGQRIIIDNEMKKDIKWWLEFLPGFSGTSILWLLDKWEYDEQLASDASLVGGGAVCQNEFFHFKFNDNILKKTSNIAQLELFTILVSLRLWGQKLAGRVVRFYTDNQISMHVINRGKSRDEFTLSCLRKIVAITAENQILLRCKFISTRDNILPDALSRWYINSEARRIVRRYTDNTWKRRSVIGNLIEC